MSPDGREHSVCVCSSVNCPNSAVSVTGHKIMHIVDLAVWTEADGLRLGVSTASDCPDSPEVGPMTLHWLPIGTTPPYFQPITDAAWI